MADKNRFEAVTNKVENYNKVISYFKNNSANPDVLNPFLASIGSADLAQKVRYNHVLSRPNIGIPDLVKADPNLATDLYGYSNEVLEQAEILMKYEGYIEREKENALKLKRLEDLIIKPEFNFDTIGGLGAEAKEKLKKFKPIPLAMVLAPESGSKPKVFQPALAHSFKNIPVPEP